MTLSGSHSGSGREPGRGSRCGILAISNSPISCLPYHVTLPATAMGRGEVGVACGVAAWGDRVGLAPSDSQVLFPGHKSVPRPRLRCPYLGNLPTFLSCGSSGPNLGVFCPASRNQPVGESLGCTSHHLLHLCSCCFWEADVPCVVALLLPLPPWVGGPPGALRLAKEKPRSLAMSCQFPHRGDSGISVFFFFLESRIDGNALPTALK